MNKKQSTISYVCANCGVQEEIPQDVLEYFDETNPEQLLFGSHRFTCEKCNKGIMAPKKETKPIVRGYGLHEGFKLD